MTEKRFEYDKGSRIMIDNKTTLHYIMTLDWECRLVTKLLNDFAEENEQLKQFKDKVFKVIDEKIIECEKAVEEIRLGEKDSYIVKHDVASKLLKELKKELTE